MACANSASSAERKGLDLSGKELMIMKWRMFGLTLMFISIASFAYADSLIFTDDTHIEGQLVAYKDSSFIFGTEQGPGIFLGRSYPADEVAGIIISSTEDELVLKYAVLESDESIKDATVPPLLRPVDVITLKTGDTKKGRMKALKEGVLSLVTSKPDQTEIADLVPFSEVMAISLSNAEHELQLRVNVLEDLVNARRNTEEILKASFDRRIASRRLELELLAEKSSGEEEEGSIYGLSDMSQMLPDMTELYPEGVRPVTAEYYGDYIEGAIVPGQQTQYGVPTDSGSYAVPQDSRRGGVTDRTSGTRRRTVERRSRRNVDSSTSYPMIESTEVIGQGDDKTVIIHYE